MLREISRSFQFYKVLINKIGIRCLHFIFSENQVPKIFEIEKTEMAIKRQNIKIMRALRCNLCEFGCTSDPRKQ